MKTKLKIHPITLGLAAGLMTSMAASSATVFSADFSSNPFTSAWTKTTPGGSYGLEWTGNFSPSDIGGPALSLPAVANAHSVYSFSTGIRTMSTVDTTIPVGVTGWTEMTYSLNFIMGGSSVGNTISVLANRSGNDGYNASIYTGGGGDIAFYGDYGLAFTGVSAAVDTWYTFKTTLTKSGADIFMQSQILNLSNTVLATSATKTFTNAAYTDPNGFKIGLGQDGGYWTQATQIDNFVVTAVPEPSTVALLGGLGALSLIRRRRTR
jgi:hypothetical protein